MNDSEKNNNILTQENSLKQKNKKELNNEKIIFSPYNLDIFLKYDESIYVYNDDFYRIPDGGCLYNPQYHKNNNIGNADVFLILKKEDRVNYKSFTEYNIYEQEDIVNKLSINELKTKFIPLIIITEKKYLKKHSNSELTYYPDYPIIEKSYLYKDDIKKWIILDSIKRINESYNYNDWVMSKINEIKLKN